MSWAGYTTFLAFVVVLLLIPGPDTAVSIANALRGGRTRGMWCVLGVAIASTVQGLAAALGLSVLITTIEPLFLTIKWVGAAYLLYLAIQAFRSARRGVYETEVVADAKIGSPIHGLRQGFLSNICNPKVIAFYLAVLPQFLGEHPSPIAVILYAVTVPVLGSLYLSGIVFGVDRARAVFSRGKVRRAMDAMTGTALIAFSLRMATE